MKPRVSRVLLPVAVALTSSLLCAQADASMKKENKDATPGQQEYTKLTAEFDAAREQWLAQRKEVQTSEAYRKARADRDAAAIRALSRSIPSPPDADFLPRFRAAAAKYESQPVEAQFLVWAALHGSPGSKAEGDVTPQLLDRHLESPEMLKLVRRWNRLPGSLGRERTREVLDTVIEKSSQPELQAEALYARAQLASRGRDVSDAAKKAAAADLERVIALAPESLAGLKAKGPEFEKTRLQIGMVAPEIVGEDLFGKPIALSDFRGKVVVLDFWGDW